MRHALQAIEERHAAELERHKMTLESELNKRLVEESSRLREIHSQQVESLAAKHEIELNLLKSQETGELRRKISYPKVRWQFNFDFHFLS